MANLRKGMEVSRILHQMPKPVVAQLDGAAAGAGLSIALSCDLRVASASCKITTAFAKVGFSGDYGGTYFLTQLLGSAKARELYLLSPILTAQEAYNLGMVTKVVPDAEVEDAARELAMSLAQGPSIALGFIKRNINNAEKHVAGGMLRRRSDPPHPRRRDRRSQGSGQGLYGEAQADVPGSLIDGGVHAPAADLSGGAASGAGDFRHRCHHGALDLLSRRQCREIWPGERAAAGRHDPARGGGADASRHRGGPFPGQDRQPRRLHGDLLLRGSGCARRQGQCDGRAHGQRHQARALSRHPVAPARLPRRLHRVQPHRRQRRRARALFARRAGLAEAYPQGHDAGADGCGDAGAGPAGVGGALGQDHRRSRRRKARMAAGW